MAVSIPLLMVPHAELPYLPFAALRRPDAEGGYLVERFEIATAPSASTTATTSRQSRLSRGKDLPSKQA